MKYGYIRVSCADKQEYLRQENILKDYNIDKLFEENTQDMQDSQNSSDELRSKTA